MKSAISACIVGVALVGALAGCERRKEAPPPPPLVADTSAIVFRKIDTVVGTGKQAGVGDRVTVHFTGWMYDPKAPGMRGQQFDSSHQRMPYPFRIGGGKVYQAWDEGVAGMRVGGKRTLVVPAAMGYGKEGAGPIPPGANLVFEIELLEVE
ncbi:FKBP-type peptidyl-prolyl cis-trans isomerase [uncultured Massilia sp.]|uniref:FKBP-type peptidyl-prolyl cis-trans isomerase n=1 Tax=uncultured Massilia sp. TaxID=169973 RepID=UPI0025ECFA39|nr:FKBP-type peptidyl-prolyl cis-trans isomerase [uncultured Massilia sp.]